MFARVKTYSQQLVTYGLGKAANPLISPWLAPVILQNFEFLHPFPSNSKQCRELSPAQGQRGQFIPLYSPTYSPGWPGVLPQGQADDMCITSNRRQQVHSYDSTASQKKMVLFINLLGKGLTQEIKGDGGSI